MTTRLLALTVCAAVLLGAAASALASRTHTTRLSPPVIHEPFAPLPCTGKPSDRSTLQMEGCGEQQVLKSDKQIDTLNKRIFPTLPSDSARRQFIAGHNAWIAYRHEYCLSASDVFQGGSEAGVVYIDCVAAVNTQHVKDLNGLLADLT
jgi:uncharacterized protein YecT (DUF1311 family)